MSPRQLNVLFCLCLMLAFVCISCASKEPPPPPVVEEPVPEEPAPPPVVEEPPPPVEFVHTVKLKGESLSIIAKWYTGELKNWEPLAKYNPGPKPNRIFLGDQIKIPTSMMVTQEPLTQEFVDESQPKGKRRASAGKTDEKKPSSEPTDAEGVPLFGPRDYGK
jgi:hypothetical protein